MAYWSVETPIVFREIALPCDPDTWSARQRRAYERLKSLAEAHQTYVACYSYRRG